MKRCIAGVGSRETPENICAEMTKIGEWCLKNEIVVRSGHASGADRAFEEGAQEQCVAFLPWSNFNMPPKEDGFITRAVYITYKHHAETEELARKYHPKYDFLSQGAKKMMCRNVWQILDCDLQNSVNAVVCYNEGGFESGGTSQAMRVAKDYNIPIFNMTDPRFSTAELVIDQLEKLLYGDDTDEFGVNHKAEKIVDSLVNEATKNWKATPMLIIKKKPNA